MLKRVTIWACRLVHIGLPGFYFPTFPYILMYTSICFENVQEGDIVLVTESLGNGWLYGEDCRSGRRGQFPESFVRRDYWAKTTKQVSTARTTNCTDLLLRRSVITSYHPFSALLSERDFFFFNLINLFEENVPFFVPSNYVSMCLFISHFNNLYTYVHAGWNTFKARSLLSKSRLTLNWIIHDANDRSRLKTNEAVGNLPNVFQSCCRSDPVGAVISSKISPHRLFHRKAFNPIIRKGGGMMAAGIQKGWLPT